MSLIIPVGLTARGVFNISKLDSRSGMIIEEREVKNLLLNNWKNYVFEGGYVGLIINTTISSTSYCACSLGDNGTPASVTDTGLKGYKLGSRDGTSTNYSKSLPTAYPAWDKMVYKLPAGTATGTVREIVIQYSAASPTGYSRIVLDPPLVKSDTDEVIVTYTRYMYRNAESFQGVIPKGQSDGVTDVSWVATINNTQLRSILCECALKRFCGYDYLTMGVDVGSSNAPTDLVNDGLYAKTRINYVSPNFIERMVYDQATNYRDIRFGFDTGYANGDIGEMAIYGVARITFNPPLKKTNNRRLYLTTRLSISGI